MKIDKAIETLDVEIRGLDPAYHPLLTDALKLGIEALKRVQNGRDLKIEWEVTLLPGETKE